MQEASKNNSKRKKGAKVMLGKNLPAFNFTSLPF